MNLTTLLESCLWNPKDDLKISNTLEALKEALESEDTKISLTKVFGILCAVLAESENRQLRARASELLENYFKHPEFEDFSESFSSEILPLVKNAVDRATAFRVIQVSKIADRIRSVSVGTTHASPLLSEIADLKYPRFGTSGVRARWGIDFNEKKAKIVAQAISDHIRKANLENKPVIIGYDSRIRADQVAERVAGVCAANGLNVILAERDTPSPALIYWAIEKIGERNVAGVINCTPSHNPVHPEEWHGIRYSPPFGGPAPTSTTDAIGSRANQLQIIDLGVKFMSLQEGKSLGKISLFNPINDYVNWVVYEKDLNIRDIRSYFRDKLVVDDEMHGASRGYFRMILDKIGVPYLALHAHRDPYLGELPCANPEEPYLGASIQKMKETQAELGFGRDTDGDRFGILDKGGIYFNPNQIITMLTDYLIRFKGYRGKVVRTLPTSRAIDAVTSHPEFSEYVVKPPQDMVPAHIEGKLYKISAGSKDLMKGLPTYVVNVGFKYIAQVMQEDIRFRNSIIIGGEESGGLSTKGHLPDKDGIWACALVLEMVAVREMTLTQIWEDVAKRYEEFGFLKYSGRKDVEASDEAKEGLINFYLEQAPKHIAGLKVVYLGGVHYDMIEAVLEAEKTKARSYLVIRASGTELLNRIYTESHSESKREEIEAEVLKKLHELEER